VYQWQQQRHKKGEHRNETLHTPQETEKKGRPYSLDDFDVSRQNKGRGGFPRWTETFSKFKKPPTNNRRNTRFSLEEEGSSVQEATTHCWMALPKLSELRSEGRKTWIWYFKYDDKEMKGSLSRWQRKEQRDCCSCVLWWWWSLSFFKKLALWIVDRDYHGQMNTIIRRSGWKKHTRKVDGRFSLRNTLLNASRQTSNQIRSEGRDYFVASQAQGYLSYPYNETPTERADRVENVKRKKALVTIYWTRDYMAHSLHPFNCDLCPTELFWASAKRIRSNNVGSELMDTGWSSVTWGGCQDCHHVRTTEDAYYKLGRLVWRRRGCGHCISRHELRFPRLWDSISPDLASQQTHKI
jgi:hypothetical protein